MRAASEDKPVLARLLELYQYDLSAIENADVDASGLYGYAYLDHYWIEPGRHPFLVRVDSQLAGFVLVNQHALTGPAEGAMTVAEFFVLRRYRRRGIGEQVAVRIFDMFPGHWEVRELAANVEAVAFWRKVVSRYTGGRFREVWLSDERWCGPVQVFQSPGPA